MPTAWRGHVAATRPCQFKCDESLPASVCQRTGLPISRAPIWIHECEPFTPHAAPATAASATTSPPPPPPPPTPRPPPPPASHPATPTAAATPPPPNAAAPPPAATARPPPAPRTIAP